LSTEQNRQMARYWQRNWYGGHRLDVRQSKKTKKLLQSCQFRRRKFVIWTLLTTQAKCWQ